MRLAANLLATTDYRLPTMIMVMRAFNDGLLVRHGPARALADAGALAGVTGFVCFGAG